MLSGGPCDVGRSSRGYLGGWSMLGIGWHNMGRRGPMVRGRKLIRCVTSLSTGPQRICTLVCSSDVGGLLIMGSSLGVSCDVVLLKVS